MKMKKLFLKKILTVTLFLILCTDLSFAQMAINKPKFVGNIVRDGNNIRANFDDYWNQVTAENAGKWGSAEPSQDNYNWTQLDNIYNYALNHNFPYKHHTLIWGNQEPGWISSLDSASQYEEVVEWITLVGQRYPDADFCDVVNEPLHDPPSYKDALGGDGTTGWDWVIKSFELARQYLSPGTKLHINEYSVINDNTANANFIQIINLLKDRGLIDGIGVQGHNFEVNGGASLNTLVNNLTNLANTGLPIYISEFDINEANDNTQLTKYQSIFPALYEHPGVVGITLWGYVQFEIWQTNAYLLDDRLAERPAMVWLKNYLRAPFRPVLISPNGTSNEPRNPVLTWHSSETATSYRVRVATNSNFTNVVFDSTLSDTTIQTSVLAANQFHYWQVSAANPQGTSPYSTSATFTTGEQVTDVDEGNSLPLQFSLEQNYPNPFNPATTIEFSVAERSFVKLELINMLGQIVKVLSTSEFDKGTYMINVDLSDLVSGTYIYRISAGNYISSKKLLLLK
ncbi:MAG: endo-1,4-beta-xylanase [Ignavibacteriales bacterium]|nr:MAG: endo-1,4-beta-xylanase [Ignavibacteriales bacterium]